MVVTAFLAVGVVFRRSESLVGFERRLAAVVRRYFAKPLLTCIVKDEECSRSDHAHEHVLVERERVFFTLVVPEGGNHPPAFGRSTAQRLHKIGSLLLVDLGTDVSPETFVQTAKEQNCQIICCSALLTTTMPVMGEVVKAVKDAGLSAKVMVGGAPITQEFADSIGADAYTADAASAAMKAAELLA